MVRLIQCFVLVLTIVFGCAEDLITFKNGRIGVNFGGYSAQAGLGGLLTGNAADGGLSASAGTPFGQHAAAGLGGQLNGDTADGGLFASAGTPGQHAAAGLGGRLNGNDAKGGLSASAGSFGKNAAAGLGGRLHEKQSNGGLSATATIPNVYSSGAASVFGNTVPNVPSSAEIEGSSHTKTIVKSVSANYPVSSIQKIKHRHHGHKKVFLQSAEIQKEIIQPQHVNQGGGGSTSVVVDTNYASQSQPPNNFFNNKNGLTLFDNIFAIPIATLQAVNQLVNNVADQHQGGAVTVQKHKTVTY